MTFYRFDFDLFYLRNEALRRLECGDIVLGDSNGGALENVAGYLLGALLDDEATETAKESVVALDQGTFHALHESLNNRLDLHFLDAGAFSDLANDICLCHIS